MDTSGLKDPAFWESPTSEVHTTEANKKAYEDFTQGKKKQRKGV